MTVAVESRYDDRLTIQLVPVWSAAMERLNWSSLVESIRGSRSGRARFFKPVCVIAAIDLADANLLDPTDVKAEAVLERFSDYVAPFFRDRGNDGFQPLWRLTNNGFWTFFQAGRALTVKDFPDGDPRTRNRLLESFDRLAIHEDLIRLWSSPEDRRGLRDQMLLMLLEGDRDSRMLVAPLFAPEHLLDESRHPSQEALSAYLAHLRQPELWKAADLPHLPQKDRDSAAATGETLPIPQTMGGPAAIEGVPSAIDYLWSSNRIVAGPDAASLPIFPYVSSAHDHAGRLEACRVLAEDLSADLGLRQWQVRQDYQVQIQRYIRRLPHEPGSGRILLADAAIRILREMFAAESVALSPPFAARLKILLQNHIALRPFYPEIEAFYDAVRTGRIEEPLPFDAVESVLEVVGRQTPTIFDESVSAAIRDASAPDPEIFQLDEEEVRNDDTILPPPDPIGGLERGKAHDFQIAGVFNRLWKVFTAADKVQSNSEAWIKAFDGLQGPMKLIINWLHQFRDG